MEFKIADLESGDIPVLDSIKPDTWSSIKEIHQHYLKTECCASVKAVGPSGELLGIGTGIVFGKTSWLAHIIVSGSHQKKGIGSRIVADRIAYLQGHCGCQSISLTATDQGYPVYIKAGFAEETLYRIMIKPEVPSFPGSEDANIIKIRPEHHEEIFHIDYLASGEDRKDFLRSVLSGGYAYIENRKVLGFYLPKFGDGGVSALTPEAGISLMRERIEENGPVFIPEENNAGCEYLEFLGYKEVKKIHRMILGKAFPRNPEYCYSRIGGFAG